jgi:hypothetical protein
MSDGILESQNNEYKEPLMLVYEHAAEHIQEVQFLIFFSNSSCGVLPLCAVAPHRQFVGIGTYRFRAT